MAKLPNYLRSHRKRLALSQDEVAFLLGTRSGAKASRYENFAREPNLATALAYEVIYQKPVSELFAGEYARIEEEVVARAKVLTHRINRGRPNRKVARKHQTFISIASRQAIKSLELA